MGLYAFFLAGSNYFAPVICGFIADKQGWKWVFYYPAMFLGAAFIFLFFFMEETNYVRSSVGVVETTTETSSSPTLPTTPDAEKSPNTVAGTGVQDQGEGAISEYKTKTFVQKLSLWQPSPGEDMLSRAIQSLKYLGWPVIFYAGYASPSISITPSSIPVLPRTFIKI